MKLASLFRLLNLLANSQSWEFSTIYLGYFPNSLSLLASNNVFIIKLVKMWLGGTLDMVVGTLKISLDQFFLVKKEFSRVQLCHVTTSGE